ncbi:Imidazole glycerol phosphate synthase subunit HisH [Serratia fonticola]|uniref:Imidazole glycerol phosphate synthase subunit HisH n=1 Tax=Serratia fonticola TaxID=47917 RepID=A0A4U9TRK5_SERFO|nr:Imidazole glycerol phosphate synthase subunit HisH [Serratia fonticola]
MQRLGYQPQVSRDPEIVLRADKLFLPGVGTAQAAMTSWNSATLIDLIKACTQPVLGICLGMQLLGSSSEENGGIKTLGIIDTPVTQMTDFGLPLPHMGWNQVTAQAGDHLFRGIEDGAYFLLRSQLCDADMLKHHRSGELRRALHRRRTKRQLLWRAVSSRATLATPGRNC